MAFYYLGFKLQADTFNKPKALGIRDAETKALHDYTGGPANGTIQHDGQTKIQYDFVTPFVAQLVRDEPQDLVLWKKFGEIEWSRELWPELSIAPSPWLNCGAPGAKYLLALVLPMDTDGEPVSLTFNTSDGGTETLGPFTTPAAVKTPVPMAFSVPIVAHELQIVPDGLCRMWLNEALWIFDPWPEFLKEATPWINGGSSAAKYTRRVTVPVETGGKIATFHMASSDGASVPFSAQTVLNVKTPVPLDFNPPIVAHEMQFLPDVACPLRIWPQEAVWECEAWPEMSQAAGPWMNFGTNKPKYMRGMTVPMDTGGKDVEIPFVSSDGATVTLTANTPAGVKTPVPFAFSVPLIGHEFQGGSPSGPARIWWAEAQPDFDEWPELTAEATGWLPVLDGNLAAFLQGLIVPIEAGGAMPVLQLKTDTGLTLALTSPLSAPPAANVKTPVPFALSTPVVCHQVQLLPQGSCRIWDKEIRWIAQPTAELAYNWKTQPTAHGLKGYQFIGRIEASYCSTQDVVLTLAAFDGTSPQTITLPSTGGTHQKVLLTPTANKFMLMSYAAISGEPFQIFSNEWTVWIGVWGRSGELVPWRGLGGLCGDGAAI